MFYLKHIYKIDLITSLLLDIRCFSLWIDFINWKLFSIKAATCLTWVTIILEEIFAKKLK